MDHLASTQNKKTGKQKAKQQEETLSEEHDRLLTEAHVEYVDTCHHHSSHCIRICRFFARISWNSSAYVRSKNGDPSPFVSLYTPDFGRHLSRNLEADWSIDFLESGIASGVTSGTTVDLRIDLGHLMQLLCDFLGNPSVAWEAKEQIVNNLNKFLQRIHCLPVSPLPIPLLCATVCDLVDACSTKATYPKGFEELAPEVRLWIILHSKSCIDPDYLSPCNA